jgi:hypothetical protein
MACPGAGRKNLGSTPPKRQWVISILVNAAGAGWRSQPNGGRIMNSEQREQGKGATLKWPRIELAKVEERKTKLSYCYHLAGVAGLEPATPGFGDRCSTN